VKHDDPEPIVLSDGTTMEPHFPPRGPVLYTKLMDIACDSLRPLIEERLVQTARNDARAVSDLLSNAYKQGLRDGFQQGVQAMSDGELKGEHKGVA
jgi:hypothetical protein